MSPKDISHCQSNSFLRWNSGNCTTAEGEQSFPQTGRPVRPDHSLDIIDHLRRLVSEILSHGKEAQHRRLLKEQQLGIQVWTSSESLQSMNQILLPHSPMCRSSNSPSIGENSQHGMELQHDIPPAARECDDSRNDSGFGSGGWGPAPSSELECDDFMILQKNEESLKNSCIYFTGLDSATARKILRDKPTGTFLIRDSADPRHLYSLSVKTDRGATSVRILYRNGLFQFDSDERIRDKLPQFDSVLSLVDFHVMITQEGRNRSWRWEDTSGGKNIRVRLTRPLKSSVPSLAQLARVKINQCLDNVHLPDLSVDRLPTIPEKCKSFLKDYPYRI